MLPRIIRGTSAKSDQGTTGDVCASWRLLCHHDRGRMLRVRLDRAGAADLESYRFDARGRLGEWQPDDVRHRHATALAVRRTCGQQKNHSTQRCGAKSSQNLHHPPP